jgi:integrase
MNNSIGGISVKARTEQTYQKQVDALYNRSIAARTSDWEIPAQVSIIQVLDDFLARTDLAASTAKTYRSALIWHIRTAQNPNKDHFTALSRLEELHLPKGPKSSTSRPRVISESDLEKLLDELYRVGMKSIWAKRTATWVLAGLASGLRPIEWLSARWDSNDPSILLARTAKVKLRAPAFIRKEEPFQAPVQSIGQSVDQDDASYEPSYLENFDHWIARPDQDAPPRRIPIQDQARQMQVTSQIGAIWSVIPSDLSQADLEDAFEKYHDQCRKVLYRACLEIWGGKKTYSLYTMRGQFSANTRAQYGPELSSEYMGHSGPDTPSRAHYGKANQAHRAFKGLRQVDATAINKPVQVESGSNLDIE